MTKTKTTIIGVIIFLMILILGLGSVLLSKNLQPLKISSSKKDNQIGSSVSSLASTSTLTTSKPCSLLKVNTYEEYAKMKNTISAANSSVETDSWKKDFFLKLLDYVKPKINLEDYKLLEGYYQQLIIRRDLDLVDKFNLVTDQYKGLDEDISDFKTSYSLNYYADIFIVREFFSYGNILYAVRYDQFGDRDNIMDKIASPTIIKEYYNTTFYIDADKKDKPLESKVSNEDGIYTNRDIFFLTYNDLKDLTPQRLFETELCKIRYDIVNTKLKENTNFNELEAYPFKYTLELGTEKTLMEIDNAIKNINTISDKEIYDYQKRFLQKLLSKNDPYSWRKDTEQIYKELKNLYEYKGTYSLYQSSELIQ